MNVRLDFIGQSPMYQIDEGETAQINIHLSKGQMETLSPLFYHGIVINQDTGEPVVHAYITLRNGPLIYQCKTWYDGTFKIALPHHWNIASIQINKKGYSTRYIGMHFLTHLKDVFYIY